MEENPEGTGRIGAQASAINNAAPILHHATWKSATALLFTNQIRERIQIQTGGGGMRPMGVLKTAARGDERTPGGRSFRHFVDVRLYLQRINALEEGTGQEKSVVASVCEAMLVKSRVSPPFTRTGQDCPHFHIYFDGRVQEDEAFGLVDAAMRLGIISGKGWYTIEGIEGKVQGKDKLVEEVRQKPDILEHLRGLIEEKMDRSMSDSMESARREEEND
jgi:recombination protein RecA